jgi:hypothetical protein
MHVSEWGCCAIGEHAGKVPVTFQLQRLVRCPEGIDAPLIEVVDHTGEQRRLSTDKAKKVNGIARNRLRGPVSVRGIDGKIDGNGLGADVARGNKQAIDQTTLGEPPCNGMIFAPEPKY